MACTLNTNTTYYARVRHKDGSGNISPWSDLVSFTTKAAAATTTTTTTTAAPGTTTTTTTAAPTTTTTTTAAPTSYTGTMAARWKTSTKGAQLIGIIDTDEWHDLDNGFTVNPQLGIAAGVNTDVLLTTYGDTGGDTTGFTSIKFTTAGNVSLTLTRASATTTVGADGRVEWRWPDVVAGTAFEADLEQQWADEGSPGSLAGTLLVDQITVTINY